MKGFIIHNTSCLERYDLVSKIRDLTQSKVFDAIYLPDGKDGCRQSHIEVARLAQLESLDRFMVFEDDCVLLDGWEQALEREEDVVFIGTNGFCEHTIFGTHALVIGSRARDLIVLEAENHKLMVQNPGAYDHILSLLIRKYGLSVFVMDCAIQKEGLKSLITGKIR